MWRQGDIIIRKTKKAKKGKLKNKIIALGEVTGHSHRFTPESKVRVYDNGNGTQSVQVIGENELVHEEHETLSLPRGEYVISVQREYDLIEGVRQVMD